MTNLLSFTRLYLTPVLGSFAGGYLFTWGFASLTIASLYATGSEFHAAEQTAFLLAVPVFLVMFFWLFISRRSLLSYSTAYGGATVMTALALWVQSFLTTTGV